MLYLFNQKKKFLDKIVLCTDVRTNFRVNNHHMQFAFYFLRECSLLKPIFYLTKKKKLPDYKWFSCYCSYSFLLCQFVGNVDFKIQFGSDCVTKIIVKERLFFLQRAFHQYALFFSPLLFVSGETYLLVEGTLHLFIYIYDPLFNFILKFETKWLSLDLGIYTIYIHVDIDLIFIYV